MSLLTTNLKTSDFDYALSEELIAQFPSQKRDSSRLLVLNRRTGAIEHKIFSDISQYFTASDLIVMNDTRVIPARLFGKKYGTGAQIEILLDKKVGENTWEALSKPAKRLDVNTVIIFGPELFAEVIKMLDDGKVLLHFAAINGMATALQKHGTVPLPPYIRTEPQSMVDRYQTVYAKDPGASAAPTAGLHFTKELLNDIPAKKAYITLHTGYGTFAPVRSEDIIEHKMHKESFSIPSDTDSLVDLTRRNGGKVIAVGTTTARALESASQGISGETDIFIYPGYLFKTIDALITNFHLPKSTLLMLVSAFAGHENIMNAYRIAVEQKYRFFSFGDAMLII